MICNKPRSDATKSCSGQDNMPKNLVPIKMQRNFVPDNKILFWCNKISFRITCNEIFFQLGCNKILFQIRGNKVSFWIRCKEILFQSHFGWGFNLFPSSSLKFVRPEAIFFLSHCFWRIETPYLLPNNLFCLWSAMFALDHFYSSLLLPVL